MRPAERHAWLDAAAAGVLFAAGFLGGSVKEAEEEKHGEKDLGKTYSTWTPQQVDSGGFWVLKNFQKPPVVGIDMKMSHNYFVRI